MISIFQILAIPTWMPGNSGYAVTMTVSALVAVSLLGLCLALAVRNPGFMRKKAT